MSTKKSVLENKRETEIVFQGVKTHNLKNIDISLPKDKIITITGVSGSGKSSLAFDTIYKEGQFRYIESLSSYLRQFFNLGTRPDVEYCSGLSPAIAIEQNKRAGNSRSTVGTLTEIDDYIRLLFAKLGNTFCYGCGKEIKPQTIDFIIDSIKKLFLDKKVFILQESGSFKNSDELSNFVKKNRKKIDQGKGFTRYLLVCVDRHDIDPIEYFYLETPNIPDNYYPIKCFGIYDRITIETKNIPRIKEDIIKILLESNKFGISIENSSEINWYTDKMYCPDCNISYPELTPQHFSANRQEGACNNCHGIGEILQLDYDKIIDPLSVYTKAILPWRDSNYGQAVLKKIAFKYDVDENVVWKDLPDRFRHIVINGDNEVVRLSSGGKYISIKYEGIENIIKEQFAKGLLTVDFQAMLEMKTCPVCNGSKLRKESLYSFLILEKSQIPKNSIFCDDSNNFIPTSLTNGLWDFAYPKGEDTVKFNIRDLHYMKLENFSLFLSLFRKLSIKNKNLIDRIVLPLTDRVETICQLGLGYLTLYRQIGTLSGGEIQRLRLAKQLGNKLTGIIYVLDEPTIGLSEKEIKKAIKAIKSLQEMGNTVIVVEHNEDFIKASDWIVEVGPRAGDFGGNIVFNGTYKEFLKSDTLTSGYITGKIKVNVEFNHIPTNKVVMIKKASKFNLHNVDVNIKLGSFTVITGPSGAGKTTLMYTTLFRFLNEKQKFVQGYIRLQLLKKGRDRQQILTAPVMNKEEYGHLENLAVQEFYKDLAVDTIKGYEEIKNTIYVDQTSIGRTPRSCPVTFVGVFDRIRSLFAGTTQAKYLGFSSGYFSFNSSKGACPGCQGYGYKKVELQFLPDTYVACDLCRGSRYKPEILEIQRHGKNINEILQMYISDALDFFVEMSDIHKELKLLDEIGLGYLKMGQPAHTLSGGESQRLKLVKHLLKSYKGHTVYFLDEPTVGLHPADIEKLLLVLKKFLDNGDTILMIEHDKNILDFADEVIKLDNGRLV